MPQYELLLREIRDEAHDIKSFIFEKPAGFSHVAGQFITLSLDVSDPRGPMRQFTVASSPTESELMITTTIRGSPFKEALLRSTGKTVKARGPFGKFTLAEGNAVMLAGGIGVTPFRSMIKAATDAHREDAITLLYSCRTPEDIAFGDDLITMERMNENLTVLTTITQPAADWPGLTGRISKPMLEENVELKDAIFYVCGPPAMVEGTNAFLAEMGISDVRSESFEGY